MISPEMQMKISAWRLKAADGTLSIDDCKEFVAHMRAGRMTAASSSKAAAAKRSKAIKTIVHADDLLNELDNL